MLIALSLAEAICTLCSCAQRRCEDCEIRGVPKSFLVDTSKNVLQSAAQLLEQDVVVAEVMLIASQKGGAELPCCQHIWSCMHARYGALCIHQACWAHMECMHTIALLSSRSGASQSFC